MADIYGRYMGFVLTETYAGVISFARHDDKIYSDPEQTQAYVDCLNAKAQASGAAVRYGIAGITPVPPATVRPAPAYAGPFHALDDSCGES